MWVLTTQGFYSVVEQRDDPETLIVRARTREDIEALRRQIPDLEPIEGAGTDYRWRAFVAREDWLVAMACFAEALDYPNFKGAVAQRQGTERAALYHRLWALLLELG